LARASRLRRARRPNLRAALLRVALGGSNPLCGDL